MNWKRDLVVFVLLACAAGALGKETILGKRDPIPTIFGVELGERVSKDYTFVGSFLNSTQQGYVVSIGQHDTCKSLLIYDYNGRVHYVLCMLEKNNGLTYYKEKLLPTLGAPSWTNGETRIWTLQKAWIVLKGDWVMGIHNTVYSPNVEVFIEHMIGMLTGAIRQQRKSQPASREQVIAKNKLSEPENDTDSTLPN